MSPEEIKAKIKDIVTNHIRSAEDPEAAAQVTADLHDVMTAKMREKVLGKTEAPADVEVEDDGDDENADEDEQE